MNDVSRRGSQAFFWLVAGAGLTAIIVLCGAVVMVRPADPVAQAVPPSPTQNGRTALTAQQQSGAGLRRDDEAMTPSRAVNVAGQVSAASNSSTNVATNVAAQDMSRAPKASVLQVPDAGSKSERYSRPLELATPSRLQPTQMASPIQAQAQAQAQARAQPQPQYATRLQPSNAPSLIALDLPMPTRAATAQAQVRAPTPKIQQERNAETIVVTAPSSQQMAFSVDNLGRGNSLVIQLPRPKRNP